jgi:hypothetical protein
LVARKSGLSVEEVGAAISSSAAQALIGWIYGVSSTAPRVRGGRPKVGLNCLPKSVRGRRQLRDVVACEAEDEPVWPGLHEATRRTPQRMQTSPRLLPDAIGDANSLFA